MGKMREKIRGWFTDSVSWLSMGQLAYSVYKLSKSYPGISDEGKLKTWITSALSTGGEVALITETEIDDNIVATAKKVVEDAEGWGFVYALLARAADLKDIPEKWNEPESAATIIAAIGLLTQLISKIREKRQNMELSEMETVRYRLKKAKHEVFSPDGERSLTDKTQAGTQKNARLLHERIFGRPMSSVDLLGNNCGTPLMAECHNFITAVIIFGQLQTGIPVIEGRNNEEHDEILSKFVKEISNGTLPTLSGLAEGIMSYESKEKGVIR